ncbi:MAG: type II secretion system protein GspL [bacterium]
MIKNIFLPEKIGNKRIIAQRIVGLALQDETVTLALVYAKRSKTIVEELLSEKLSSDVNLSYAQRASEAIKKIMLHVKNFDQIRIAIPASIVTFKELQVPFDDVEKIRMVLDYEIESMLPFSISNAVIDFIITKHNKEQKSTQVLVAAVQNQDLQAELDIYTQAGVEPSHITIDLFATYGLYKQISDYASIEKGSILVEVGETSTRIAFLQNGELRLTRTMPRGIISIVKNISEESGMDAEKVKEHLDLNGVNSLGGDALAKIFQNQFINFFNDIQFTLNSFSLKLNFYDEITKIIFTQKANQVKGFVKLCSDTLQIPCESFDWRKVFEIKSVKKHLKNIDYGAVDFVTAIGTAIPCYEQDQFDLRRKSFVLVDYKLVSKQIIAVVVLLTTMFLAIGVHGYMQISTLRNTLDKTEKTEISRLKAIFPKDHMPKKQTLQAFVQEAQKLVREKTDLWSAFRKERLNPLEIMLELTNIADKTRNNIYFTDLSINSKDKGGVEIDVDGYFKSKKGSGSHFNDWLPIELRFKESLMFTLLEDPINTTSIPDMGVKFSAKLKLKEKEK